MLLLSASLQFCRLAFKISEEIMTEKKTIQPIFWKQNWVKNSLIILVFVAIYIAIRPFMQGDVIEGKAPNLKLESISGQPISLSQYKGQAVLVHLWATWCPICEFERDGIEEIAKSYPVINIATQSMDDEGLLEFAHENKMNADILVNDFDGNLMKQFGARAVPASFIINSDGEIQFIEVGYTSKLGLKARLWLAD